MTTSMRHCLLYQKLAHLKTVMSTKSWLEEIKSTVKLPQKSIDTLLSTGFCSNCNEGKNPKISLKVGEKV